MEIFLAFLVPALVGVGVGVLSGLLGIGGGTVLVPVFRLTFSMSAVGATATSLFTIVPTSLSGVITHVRQKTCIPLLGVAAGLGGALTSPFGVWLASISPGWLIMTVAALIVGYSAINMLRKALSINSVEKKDVCSKEKVVFAGERAVPSCEGAVFLGEGSVSSVNMEQIACVSAKNNSASLSAENISSKQEKEENTFVIDTKKLAIGAAIGLFAGLASGYVGVGGGFIMVPFMLSLLAIPMKQVSGTSLVAVAILAVPGVITQALLGNVDYVVGLAVAIGSIPGAMLGAKLVNVVPEKQLRFLFGGFLLIAALLLVVNELGVLG